MPALALQAQYLALALQAQYLGLQDAVLQAQCYRSRPLDTLQVPELLQELALPEQYLQL